MLFRSRSVLTPNEPRIPLAEAEATLLRAVTAFPEKPILLGNTVHFDRSFAKHWLPAFEATLSHRHVDCTTLRLLFNTQVTQEGTKHRALDDAKWSVALARKAVEGLRL